jgi:hypothetical protein
MIPHASVRVAVVIGFLLWIFFALGGSLLGLVGPPQRIRQPDTAAIPADDVNPRPSMGTLPPPRPLSEAQAFETLRQKGYVDVTRPEPLGDGVWTATGIHAGTAGRVGLRVERDGRVIESPVKNAD